MSKIHKEHLDDVDIALASAEVIMRLINNVRCPGCAMAVLLHAISSIHTGVGFREDEDHLLIKMLEEEVKEKREMRDELIMSGILTPEGDLSDNENRSSSKSCKYH